MLAPPRLPVVLEKSHLSLVTGQYHKEPKIAAVLSAGCETLSLGIFTGIFWLFQVRAAPPPPTQHHRRPTEKIEDVEITLV